MIFMLSATSKSSLATFFFLFSVSKHLAGLELAESFWFHAGDFFFKDF